MADFDVKEKRFEQDIEEYLLAHGGYQKGNPAAFNREKALDTGTFLSFIRTSQPKQWERFEKIYGADSERQLIDRFCREVKLVGLLKVLRQGFTDRGIKFRAVFWKPETSINETSQAQYAANILHCTRQLHYSLSNENSIDIVLFLNGIPVVSMELKCQFTGQDTANAIQQYKFDRAGKDAIFEFKNRVLVHFAVDLTNVYMTTRLEGAKTYFLPFNQGSNGAGNVGGKGNAGVNGGPNGDLHVYVSVRPHPLFERRGNDVWCEMPITFTQAALGADVEVPTLDARSATTSTRAPSLGTCSA